MSDGDRRVEIVNEHMRLENAYDFPACIAQFARPRYEVKADGEVYDGAAGVEHFLSENRRAFPDFRFEPSRVAPTADAVVVEGSFTGTHEGFWRGLPPTGHRVDFPMCLIFDFEGDDMVNERLYFDVGTALQQLGVEFDPDSARGKIAAVLTHPVTMVKALVHTARLGLFRRRG